MNKLRVKDVVYMENLHHVLVYDANNSYTMYGGKPSKIITDIPLEVLDLEVKNLWSYKDMYDQVGLQILVDISNIDIEVFE